MATEWKSQQGEGKFALQFETDCQEKYRLVEKAAQMAMDGKTEVDFVEVVRCKDCEHKQELSKWEKRTYVEGCVACERISPGGNRTIMCPDDFCSYGERTERSE